MSVTSVTGALAWTMSARRVAFAAAFAYFGSVMSQYDTIPFFIRLRG